MKTKARSQDRAFCFGVERAASAADAMQRIAAAIMVASSASSALGWKRLSALLMPPLYIGGEANGNGAPDP
ncbi:MULTISPECIES: hypothetical protein [Bradyrhizobium]|uniref:Uncharacterized protein n=1 Tax=Bradyrhizobium elkanii TaxID=29448 RepID=A0A8I2C2T0_BRAEL|nr:MULTISPECIES: hypothetical protein [Bradyrhizobium]MBP1292809.1 hypothetical protein [Bradyrhizobium elkanii]MCS3475789.1 hypothetical protein [Bradyrhizobium elkanii]MCS3582638.1 hypothetical protein [Bradyrhizobium elkanii]MCS3716204.1 hypothetical protein [Bradyrhizobium elkanii]MCS4009924.1 hypothetical protein [Bradyrhizobium elkanii USDA 61]